MILTRSIWFWALALSVLLHGALVVYLVATHPEPADASRARAPRGSTPAASQDAVAADATAEPGSAADQDTAPAVTSPAQVKQLVQTMADRARALDDPAKVRQLTSSTEQLAVIPPQRVADMARFIEAALGLEEVAAAAPNPDAVGPFDHDSGTLYDIERRTAESGDTVYAFTLVDQAGRTLVSCVPASEMSGESRSLFETFELGRRNPAMRTLIDLVRKMAAKEQAAERPADR